MEESRHQILGDVNAWITPLPHRKKQRRGQQVGKSAKDAFNQRSSVTVYATRANTARMMRYQQYQAELKQRREEMESVVKGLYLKLGWDLVTTAFVPTFVRSFHPRTITIKGSEIRIQIGEHQTSGSDIIRKLERLVRKKLLVQMLDCASTKTMPSEIKKKHQEVAKGLTKIMCEKFMKSSVITTPASFPSAGHLSRAPVPACLADLTKFVQHAHFELAIHVSQSAHDYFYLAELYTLQNGIVGIKDHLPFLKTITLTVKEVTGFNSTITYVARGRFGSAMLMRITTPASFACSEETTLEEEVEVLDALMKSIPGIK